jgi:NAD(P)-dependent dehydrogenase (short-subunit alcohol dehydrogenase family)
MSLDGRIAVVTGGASGIGRSICLRLARQGLRIAILDLDLAGARRVADEVAAGGGRALAIATDVRSAGSVQAAAAQVHEALGPAAVLVNDAGIAGLVPFPEMTEAQWQEMLDVHMTGTFRCTRAFIGDMLAAGWGRIVNIASVAGLRGGPALVHYSAAKAGIIGFTKALAAEVGPQGITVNAIAPGLIDTPLLRKSGFPEGIVQQLLAISPIKRIGIPEDVAAACAYLVSEEASFFTGQVMSPNGGGHV